MPFPVWGRARKAAAAAAAATTTSTTCSPIYLLRPNLNRGGGKGRGCHREDGRASGGKRGETAEQHGILSTSTYQQPCRGSERSKRRGGGDREGSPAPQTWIRGDGCGWSHKRRGAHMTALARRALDDSPRAYRPPKGYNTIHVGRHGPAGAACVRRGRRRLGRGRPPHADILIKATVNQTREREASKAAGPRRDRETEKQKRQTEAQK